MEKPSELDRTAAEFNWAMIVGCLPPPKVLRRKHATMAFPLRPRKYWMAPGALNLGYQRQNTGAYLSPLGPSFMTEPFEAKLNSILTRLRIWMRRASKRRLRTIREMYRKYNMTLDPPEPTGWVDRPLKLGRNNLSRGGPFAAVGGISGMLHFGAAHESINWGEGERAAFIGNEDPRYLGRMIDDVWTKNQRARLQ